MRFVQTNSGATTVFTSDGEMLSYTKDHGLYDLLAITLQEEDEKEFLSLFYDKVTSRKIEAPIQMGFEFEFGAEMYDLKDHLIRYGFTPDGHDGLKDLEVGSDGSVDPYEPYEVITKPRPYNEAMALFEQFFDWMNANDAITDYSCGVHVNVSFIDRQYNELLHPGKLLYLYDEEGISEKFGRLNNFYCKPWSQTGLYRKVDPENFNEVRGILCEDRWGTYMDKYRSVNLNHFYHVGGYNTGEVKENPRVEFRSIGNTDYHHRRNDVKESIEHMIDCFTQSTNDIAVAA